MKSDFLRVLLIITGEAVMVQREEGDTDIEPEGDADIEPEGDADTPEGVKGSLAFTSTCNVFSIQASSQ